MTVAGDAIGSFAAAIAAKLSRDDGRGLLRLFYAGGGGIRCQLLAVRAGETEVSDLERAILANENVFRLKGLTGQWYVSTRRGQVGAGEMGAAHKGKNRKEAECENAGQFEVERWNERDRCLPTR